MYFIGMEDFISKKEKEIEEAREESHRQAERELAMRTVADIVAPPIFSLLKWIGSLLH
jgi:hypothetical protein